MTTKIPAVMSMSWSSAITAPGREARAEAEADVDQDQQGRDAERGERRAAQIAPHLRADELDALDRQRADLVTERERQAPDLEVRRIPAARSARLVRRQLLEILRGERTAPGLGAVALRRVSPVRKLIR